MERIDSLMARWEVQLRKGLLEFVILLALRDREQYGFELMRGIAAQAPIDMPEGTLYPLLLRLARDGLVSHRMARGDGGAPRKYYALTSLGREAAEAMSASWTGLNAAVSPMIEGGSR